MISLGERDKEKPLNAHCLANGSNVSCQIVEGEERHNKAHCDYIRSWKK